MSLLLDWRVASQPADVLRPVVEALRQGNIVALPSESGYIFAVSAALPDATGRLQAVAGESADLPSMLVSSVKEIEPWAARLSAKVCRLAERLWPGPLGLSVAHAADCNTRTRFRSPNHTATAAIMREAGCTLLAINVGKNEQDPAEIADRRGDSVTLVVDAGPIPAKSITWLAVDNSDWRVEQVGEITEIEMQIACAEWIVFVCTGNTCRSPMAESLFKARLAAKLGCNVDDLPANGFLAMSAGVSAYPGDAPSSEAVDVLHDLDADLSSHRSQLLAADIVANADHLVGMTRSHLLAVLTRYSVLGGSMRLLCGAEGDLDDPIGGGREVYEACARTIIRHVDRLIQELVR